MMGNGNRVIALGAVAMGLVVAADRNKGSHTPVIEGVRTQAANVLTFPVRAFGEIAVSQRDAMFKSVYQSPEIVE